MLAKPHPPPKFTRAKSTPAMASFLPPCDDFVTSPLGQGSCNRNPQKVYGTRSFYMENLWELWTLRKMGNLSMQNPSKLESSKFPPVNSSACLVCSQDPLVGDPQQSWTPGPHMSQAAKISRYQNCFQVFEFETKLSQVFFLVRVVSRWWRTCCEPPGVVWQSSAAEQASCRTGVRSPGRRWRWAAVGAVPSWLLA